jgi:hypothetical protein
MENRSAIELEGKTMQH